MVNSGSVATASFPVADGVVRLDTRTGAVSTCSNAGAGWACYSVPDERAALDAEIGRLQADNEKSKTELEKSRTGLEKSKTELEKLKAELAARERTLPIVLRLGTATYDTMKPMVPAADSRNMSAMARSARSARLGSAS